MTASGWIAYCPRHRTHAVVDDGPARRALADVEAALRSARGACDATCAATALVGRRPLHASEARGWNPASAPLARVLVLVERPDLGRAGITQARRLLADPDADVLVLAVVPAGAAPEATARAEQALEPLVGPLLEHGVRTYARVAHGSLAQQGLAHAASFGAQLVVLATDAPPTTPGGRAWGRDAVRLLHECPAPLLLLAEDEAHRPPRRLLVPLDGSARAAELLPLVTAFALAHDAEVVLLRVGPDLAHPGAGPVTAVPEACARELEAGLAPALRALQDAGVRARTHLAYDASPARAITEVAAAVGADLIALTGRGAAGWRDWPLGSAADAVVRRASVPLLVHRPPPPARETVVLEPPLELARPAAASPRPSAAGAVVVTTDGSPLGDAAAALLPRLVPSLAASAVLLQVLPDDGPAEARHEGLRAAQDHLRGLEARLTRAGIVTEAHVVRGDTVERILASARPPAVRLLVMTSHGRSGASRFVRGSVAERVLRRAEVPVLVATPAALLATDLHGPRFERVLLADDGSPAAARALAVVGELARAHDGEVTLLGVAPTSVDVGPLVRTLREHAECVGGRTRLEVVVGDPAAEIVRAAAGADLVVASTHGRGGLARAWLGSVTEEVLRRVDRPLLVVHA